MSVEELNKIREAVETLEETLYKKAENHFKEQSEILFKEHPELESFSWTQYTPHYNDGDPCTFISCHDFDELLINGKGTYDEDEDNTKYVDYSKLPSIKNVGESYEDYDNRRKEALLDMQEKLRKTGPVRRKIVELLDSLGDDCLEKIFKGNATVTVTVDGYETEYYYDT